MATTPVTKRINQSVKTETKDTLIINGWNLLFTYKSPVGGKPDEFMITGSKLDLQGSIIVNIGTGNDGAQFMGGALYDKQILDVIMDEIDIIKA